MKPPSEKISESGFLRRTEQERTAQTEQSKSDDLQRTRHHQLPRRDDR